MLTAILLRKKGKLKTLKRVIIISAFLFIFGIIFWLLKK